MVYLSGPNNLDTKDVAGVSESLRPTGRPLPLGQRSFPFHDFTFNLSEEPSVSLDRKRQGKHTIDRFNLQWVCRFHYDRWNADRARFLADRLGCQMEEL
jgi:hypothetical protein